MSENKNKEDLVALKEQYHKVYEEFLYVSSQKDRYIGRKTIIKE